MTTTHTPGPWATDIMEAAKIVSSEGAYDGVQTYRNALLQIADGGLTAKALAKIARKALDEEQGDARIDEACVYVDHGGAKGSTICSFMHKPDEGLLITDAEQQANARLVAAAPDMLKALQALDISNGRDRRGTPDYDITVSAATLNLIIEAIAKATA